MLTIQHTGFTQNAEDRKKLSNFSSIVYRLPQPAPLFSLPVSGIEVHDIRFDTTVVGMVDKNSGGSSFIKVKKGTEGIQDYYRSLVTTQSGTNVLHCFIRKLLLTDHIDIDNNEDVRSMAGRYDRNEKSGVFYTVDFYEQENDIYRPLYRFDTLISNYISIEKDETSYLQQAFKASLTKATTLDWSRVREKARVLNRHAIDSFNTARFNLPVLRDTLVKGIYFTYNDFKQNNPSRQEFSIDRSKKGDFLYTVNDKGDHFLQREIWGYCDGKERYLYSASNFFKLYRTGNGFTIYGAKEITGTRKWRPTFAPNVGPGGGIYGGSTSVNIYAVHKELFQVDMETGKIY